MHHAGANSAALVTTGQLSTAAREWLIGKPIQVWDAVRLKQEWGVAVAVLASQVIRSVLPDGTLPTKTNSRPQVRRARRRCPRAAGHLGCWFAERGRRDGSARVEAERIRPTLWCK